MNKKQYAILDGYSNNFIKEVTFENGKWKKCSVSTDIRACLADLETAQKICKSLNENDYFGKQGLGKMYSIYKITIKEI